jgi:L-lysine exporter family protein LysE/ArgO
MLMKPFLEGCGTSAALIIAIGAQNAFVLKQGILKRHVFITALFCSLADSLLIALGVLGIGELLSLRPILVDIAKWGGILFLVGYGARSFRAAFTNHGLTPDKASHQKGLKWLLMSLFVVSFLNPHALLDAMVLLGSISAKFCAEERPFFALGAILTSVVWFFSLSYGARFLAPLFANPKAWKVLDFLIGCMMWILAILLFTHKTGTC